MPDKRAPSKPKQPVVDILAVAAPPTLEAWVDALIEDRPDPTTPKSRPADQLDELATRFGLDDVEHTALLVLGAIERCHALQRKVGALTVGHLRALLGKVGMTGVEARLAPDRILRARALVHVVGSPPRLVAATDVVRLVVGLEPRLVGLAPGLLRCHPNARVPSELAQKLSSSTAQIVLHEVAWTPALAQTLADGLGRPVIYGNARRLDAGCAARLRRDADLEGAVLWLSQVPEELLEVLLAPPPAAPRMIPLVVLSEHVGEPRVDVAWQLRRERITATIEASMPAPRNELDYIRALAQRDAERAMGIVRQGVTPVPRQSVPGRIVDASVRLAEKRPAPESAPEPESAPAVAVPAVAVQTSTPQAAITHAVPASAEPVPGPVSPSTSPAGSSAPDEPDGPRLDIALDAPLDQRARAAMQSGSAQQRIELLESLAGTKHPAVIAALRHNAGSEHTRLKAVAERLMTQLFGPAWNRSRAITKPVQPPRTDE